MCIFRERMYGRSLFAPAMMPIALAVSRRITDFDTAARGVDLANGGSILSGMGVALLGKP
jgi:hypothetical protein